MPYDEDDIYEDDEELEEDELEELREEREARRWARERAGQRVAQFQEAFIRGMFKSGAEYRKEAEAKPAPWLVENFIECGSLVILGGNSKSGKSCLATALAMAVANGEPFLGQATLQSPILWCALEESRQERLRILDLFGETPDHFFITHTPFHIDDEIGEKIFKLWTSWFVRPPLIVIDPLFGATDANLAEGRAARKALMGLKRLANRTGATVIVIHHVNKDSGAGLTRERFAESNQILATASMDILMDSRDKPDGNGGFSGREIRLQSRGRGAHANRTWLLRSTSPAHYEVIADAEAGKDGASMHLKAILAALDSSPRPLSAEEIATGCNQHVNTTRNRLAQLAESGKVTVLAKRGKTKLFALTQNQ